jgi:hypothetical protein
MEKDKPTKEEILEIVTGKKDGYWPETVLKAMDEWAEIYHKEKLREELVRFTIFISKMDYKDAAAERVINDYLEIIE